MDITLNLSWFLNLEKNHIFFGLSFQYSLSNQLCIHIDIDKMYILELRAVYHLKFYVNYCIINQSMFDPSIHCLSRPSCLNFVVKCELILRKCVVLIQHP